MENVRRVGAHYLTTESGTLQQCVVELIGDRVVNYYTFTTELPMTEWLGGTIELRRNEEGVLNAWFEGRKLETRNHNI